MGVEHIPSVRKRPGSDEPTVKIDAGFEEAVRQAMKVPKPQEGFPDFRVRKPRQKPSEER
jgi:hypothetical protein